jgi:hypothetical protein
LIEIELQLEIVAPSAQASTTVIVRTGMPAYAVAP